MKPLAKTDVYASGHSLNGSTGTPKLATTTSVTPYPDPVDMRVLGSLEAEVLFSLFHEHLNPFIRLFDRHLHTFSYTRSTSIVLFSSILAVSAKFFRSDLYPTLLAHAQQLVSRGMADTLVSIDMAKAICTLVYWREPSDASAWLKIGWAFRIAYLLKMNTGRTTPLPESWLEARQIIDRERTWVCLKLFNHAFLVHANENDFPQTQLPDARALERWIEEITPYDCQDDLQLVASIEIARLMQLCRTLESVSSAAAAEALATHISGVLDDIQLKYLDSTTSFASILGLPVCLKLRFQHAAAGVLFGRACVTSSGMQDEIALTDFMSRVTQLVACVEELAAEDGVLERMHNAVAVPLFSLAEFLPKLFFNVDNVASRRSTVEWMTQVYAACMKVAGDKTDSPTSFIARFYRLVLRYLAVKSLAQLSGGPGVDSETPIVEIDLGLANPFANLGPLGNELFSDLTPGGNSELLTLPSTQDVNYWESLFPGLSPTTWNWLNPSIHFFSSNANETVRL